jgi:hypothetical protein
MEECLLHNGRMVMCKEQHWYKMEVLDLLLKLIIKLCQSFIIKKLL